MNEEEFKMANEENKETLNPFKVVQDFIPKNVSLDEECILFEKPRIDDDLPEKTEKSSLNLYE